jgi:hypothetical protein
MGHFLLLLPFTSAIRAYPVEIEPMIRHLIPSPVRHLPRPVGNVTEVQLSDLPAFFANDVVVMVVRFTKPVLHVGPFGNLENDFQRLKEIETSIDGCEADFSLFLMKRLIKFLRAERSQRRGKLLIDQESRMTQAEFILSDQFFEKLFVHAKLKEE